MEPKQHLLSQHKVKFSGKAGEYFQIWLANLVLTIVTLGIYSAWATVRRRRYFYQNTEIAGAHFEYHAKPIQILIGRLIMFAVLVVFSIINTASPDIGGFLLLLLCLLLPWLAVRSWRFQARMSSYRGVHFDFTCATGQAYRQLLLVPMVLFIALGLVTTFGICLAADSNDLGRLLSILPVACLFFFLATSFIQAISSQLAWSLYVNHHYYGDYAFSAALSKKAFIRIMLIGLLIMLPFIAIALWQVIELINSGLVLLAGQTGGRAASQAVTAVQLIYAPFLAGIWFSSNYIFIATRNYVFGQTRMGEKLRLQSALSYLSWMKLLLVNLLLVVCTLGLAIPLAQIRCARYLAQRCWLEGELPDNDKSDGATEKVTGAIAAEFVPVEGIGLDF